MYIYGIGPFLGEALCESRELFYIIENSFVRNILLCKKRSAKDRTLAEWKVLLTQPDGGGELIDKDTGEEGERWIIQHKWMPHEKALLRRK